MYIPYTGSIFTVSNYKHIQTSIAIFIGNKFTKIFCLSYNIYNSTSTFSFNIACFCSNLH